MTPLFCLHSETRHRECATDWGIQAFGSGRIRLLRTAVPW